MQRLINFNLRDIRGTKQGPYIDSCTPPLLQYLPAYKNLYLRTC